MLIYKITTESGKILKSPNLHLIIKEIYDSGDKAVVFSYEGKISRKRTHSFDLIRENELEMRHDG